MVSEQTTHLAGAGLQRRAPPHQSSGEIQSPLNRGLVMGHGVCLGMSLRINAWKVCRTRKNTHDSRKERKQGRWWGGVLFLMWEETLKNTQKKGGEPPLKGVRKLKDKSQEMEKDVRKRRARAGRGGRDKSDGEAALLKSGGRK